MKALYTTLDGQQAYMLVVSSLLSAKTNEEKGNLAQVFSTAVMEVEQQHPGALEAFLRAFLNEGISRPVVKNLLDETITTMIDNGYVMPMEPKMTGRGKKP